MNYSLFDKNDEFVRYKDIKSVCLLGNESVLEESDITIIMPIYQHPDYMEEALNSALNQTYKGKYAILIVDNDSEGTSGSFEIVKRKESEKIVYYRNEKNIGVAGNWNRGVELTKSKYLTFLHDDDTLTKDALQTLISYEKQLKRDMPIFSMSNMIDENSLYINKSEYEGGLKDIPLLDALIINNFGNGEGSLLIRQQIIEIGGFPESYYPCLDYAFFIKLLYFYGAKRCMEGLLNYRIAANYQITGWKTLCECDERIRLEFLKIVKLPNGLLRRLVKKQTKVRLARSCEKYGPNENGVVYSASKMDKGLVLFYERLISRLKYIPGILKKN